jgi:hypothetical protein
MSTSIKLTGVSALPETKEYRGLRSTMETVLIDRKGIESWILPPFQRPLRVNAKVLEVSEQIKKDGGIIPGVILIGVLNKAEKYLIDGQHRVKAFLLTELPEAIADVRMIHFESMSEMGVEFDKINGRLVVHKPDDSLRALEGAYPTLQHIRDRCPFIGYDMVRRNPKAPLLSMSLAIRAWMVSANEVPQSSSISAREQVERMDMDEAKRMAEYFCIVYDAWRNDPEYLRCWSALNITITAWLWRRCVLTTSSPRVTKFTPAQFGQAMLALTADQSYLDWLVGRNVSERNRSPCYSRVKNIIVKRMAAVFGKKVILPSPSWSNP